MTRAALTALALFLVPASAQAEEIRWHEDLEKAQEAALEEKKLIIIDFWADWCGPCRKMERETWIKPSVVAKSTDFIFAKVNFDKSPPLNRWYGVDSIPRVVIADGYGTKLTEFAGFMSPAQFLSVIRTLPEDVPGLYELVARHRDDKKNAALLLELGERYSDLDMPAAALLYLEKAAKAKPIKKDPDQFAYVTTLIAYAELQLGDAAAARRRLERCMKKIPESAQESRQLAGLVWACFALEKDEAARGYLATLEQRHPNDDWTRKAKALAAKQ